jgi:hypothetical protein
MAENTIVKELIDKTFSVLPLYDKLGPVNKDLLLHYYTI